MSAFDCTTINSRSDPRKELIVVLLCEDDVMLIVLPHLVPSFLVSFHAGNPQGESLVRYLLTEAHYLGNIV